MKLGTVRSDPGERHNLGRKMGLLSSTRGVANEICSNDPKTVEQKAQTGVVRNFTITVGSPGFIIPPQHIYKTLQSSRET